MIAAAIALVALLIALVALKLFAKAKSEPRIAAVGGGIVRETSSSQIDDFVTDAEAWTQHLRPMPLFWVACFFTVILLILDYQFGISRAGLIGGILLGSLFAAADVAIPFIALKGDARGHHDAVSWVLLVLFTLMSMVVVIGSTAEVSTTTGAKTDVGILNHQDNLKLLQQKQAERDSIKIDRGADALTELAKQTEEAANREEQRSKTGKPVCGPKCESLKKESTDYRARADDARRKEMLTADIEALKAKLNAGGTTESRLDSDPLATAIEGMSFGYLSRGGVRAYGLTVLGVLLVVGVTMVWLQIGRDLREEIEWESRRRGEIADASRAVLGLAPKYTAPEIPQALLPRPTTTRAADDPSVTLNVSISDMLRRYGNDANLLEVNGLFGTLLEPADAGQVTIAATYKAYQVAVLSRDPNARYMLQSTLAEKIVMIAQSRSDVQITADGVIKGWILKPADKRLEAINANAQ